MLAGALFGLATYAVPFGMRALLDERATALAAYMVVALVIAAAGRRAGIDWRRLFGPQVERATLPLALVMVPVALLTFAAALVVYIPLSYVAPDFVRRMLLEPDSFTTVTSVGEWLFLMLVGVIAAPVVEEVLFRGILLHRWARRWGTTTGVVASSALFALLHQEWLGHWLFGVALCAVYLRTRSLWLPIAAHAANNFVFLLPSLAPVFTNDPPAAETMAELRASAVYVLPLAGAGLLAGALYLRRWWPEGVMPTLRGSVPYDRA